MDSTWELSLYPVEEGIPDLLVRANDLIKPIRCNDLKLTTLDAWDDDPNPRFDIESPPQWIARFDEDSSWPEGKRVNKVSNLSLEEEKLKVKVESHAHKQAIGKLQHDLIYDSILNKVIPFFQPFQN